MQQNERHILILNKLGETYPDARCELDFSSPFQLLIATILSAQCTDKRVNLVTQELFKTSNTPEHFAFMEQAALEKMIFSCGFYRNKAANIIAASHDIIQRFNGEVPQTLDELISLKGVGRKTANVVLSNAFKAEAVAVDTHVFRVSRRLGFSAGTSPYEVEKDLTALFKGGMYGKDGTGGRERHGDGNNKGASGISLGEVHHLLIFHGRYCCHSRKPACSECPVNAYCPYPAKTATV